MTPTNTLKTDGLLLLASVIWGFAFVAQRIGMDHVGPFIFNGIRFALGGLTLAPLLYLGWRRGDFANDPPGRIVLLGGALTGVALFLGASLQQIGIVHTTAGKAGFITGLYVVLVPILGLFLREPTAAGTWLGASVAVAGLYLVSVTGRFTIDFGDLLVLVSAVFWAAHVLLVGHFARKIAPLKLALLQFAVCSLLSLAAAGAFERNTLQGIGGAAPALLYGGVCSVGIAYTLQVVAQRRAHPSHAAIILSLEAVFAGVGGWLLLQEQLSPRGLLGCALMLAGMLLSQLSVIRAKSRADVKTG